MRSRKPDDASTPSRRRGAYTSDVERALRGMKSQQGHRIQFSRIEDQSPESALHLIGKALIFGPIMCAMKGKGLGAKDGYWAPGWEASLS
jgi:hypothetical protein